MSTPTLVETTHGSMKRIVCTWLADSTAVMTVTTTQAYSGKLEILITDPGSPLPDANWDVEVLDSNSLDVLHGAGANRDATGLGVTEYVYGTSLGAVADDKLTFNITNVDVGVPYSRGTIYLYIR